ncbi:MAG TPA: YraN family protein [Thermoclostridium sp.]|nr:YraN family protein [Thermoclostridium sp.]
MNNYELGKMGESYASDYLKKRDFHILAQNYRVGRLGEIDLIATKNEQIFFVEVKSRTGYSFGTPAEAVSYKKQRTIRNVAACFLKEYGKSDIEVHFDIIEIIMTKDGRLTNMNYLANAF